MFNLVRLSELVGFKVDSVLETITPNQQILVSSTVVDDTTTNIASTTEQTIDCGNGLAISQLQDGVIEESNVTGEYDVLFPGRCFITFFSETSVI